MNRVSYIQSSPTDPQLLKPIPTHSTSTATENLSNLSETKPPLGQLISSYFTRMGICLSSEDRELKERSTQIDRLIEEDSRRLSKECKILLLGSGESGKSTIVKQMKIIHQNGYSPEELHLFRPIIYKNILDCIKDLVLGFKTLNMKPDSASCQDFILNYPQYLTDFAFSGNFSPEFVNGINELYQNEKTQEVLDHTSEFYILDSCHYFFENIQRIGDPSFIPTVQDVLRARAKTTGIIETRFTMGQMHIHMFDVGGQRSERKKWIHCFESVTSIIFCVALSEYDQVLLEEKGQNRLMESLVLFESITNSRWFLRTSIILFLNKTDLFRKKIPKSPLEKYFTDYSGGSDPNKAAKYILWRFTQTNRAKLVIYPHLTQATDTSNIRLVFAAVKETILQNALKDSGIL